MIVELGHFALILALFVATHPVRCAAHRASHAGRAADGDGGRLGSDSFRADRGIVPCSDLGACRVRFLGGERLRELPLRKAAPLQNLRRLGQPRRLHASVGADPFAFRRGGLAFRREPSPGFALRRACHSGCDLGDVRAFHHRDLEPFLAHRRSRRSKGKG